MLTDYNRYTEFIPDLRLSRVVARRGAMVTVEQSGDAAIWLFKMPLDVTFEIKETPPNSLQSRAVGGSLRALTSSYELTPVGAGIRLDYLGRVAPGFELFGPIEQSCGRAQRCPSIPGARRRNRASKRYRAFAFECECKVRGGSLLAKHRDSSRLRPRSDSVVTFRIDTNSGTLGPTGHVMPVPTPVCVKFLSTGG